MSADVYVLDYELPAYLSRLVCQWAALAYTGLRWGEATALRVHRVDLERRRVHVVTAFAAVGGLLVEGTPKTHRNRSVPLPRFLADELAKHVVEREPSALVFSGPTGAPLRSANFRTRVWLPATAACGLPGLRVHDLRHTAASLAIGAGANVKAVQQMLGHASAAMTLDVYVGLLGDDLDSIADRLDAAPVDVDADSSRTAGPPAGPGGPPPAAEAGSDDD